MSHTYLPSSPVTQSAVKIQLEKLKQAEQSHFLQCSVKDLIAQRTQFCDDLLAHLWQVMQLAQELDLTLVAVGGYGRQEMFPLSDLDFLIISAQPLTEQQAEKVSAFIQFLWDCHFEVGQAVRTLEECLEQGKNDITIATNLLEARYLCGNFALFNQLESLLQQKEFWPIQDFFHAKIREKKARYERYNNTSYNLEPDIKYSPGGLRNLHLIYWLALKHLNAKNLDRILQLGFIYPEEFNLLQESQQFLFKVRFALHLILKRSDNRLLFDRQLKVSEMLGYTGQGNQAVEMMMKDFFRALQTIALISEILTKHYEEHFLSQADLTTKQALDVHFELCDNSICMQNKNCFIEQPDSILDLFFHLTQYPQAEIHSSTLRHLFLALRQQHHPLSQLPKARNKFLQLFSQPNAIQRAFVPMHQMGVLSAYLPQWQQIVGLMQFDLFHNYSVDEHTLRVMLKLESFTLTETAEQHPVCCKIFQQNSYRTLLYLAALFHDIAKGRGGDHAELGADDMIVFAQLHGFNDEETDLMQWLVRQHLTMSVTAQRRDIHNPEVIKAFAQTVQNQQRLDLLICLTVADICATNLTLWNSWKRSLLASLYQYTTQQFQQGTETLLDNQTTAAENRQQAVHLLRGEIPLAQLEQLWARCPDDYFLRNNPKQLAAQAQLLCLAYPDEEIVIKISNRFAQGGTEIFLYCPDQPHLFNKVVCTLDAKNLSIHDAQIITSNDGYVFDNFIVTELDGSLVRSERRREVEQLLKQVLTENKVIKRSSKKNHRLQHFQVNTEVRFLNVENPDYTELELFALDKAGFLADVSSIFTELNLNLANAKITTVGEKVEDFFILTNSQEKALTATERAILTEKLKAKLD